MTAGIIDSTVIVYYFRKLPAARAWVDTQPQRLAITPITWLEVMRGAPGKTGQAAAKALMGRFEMEYLTRSDMDWAMEQMERYRLSHGVEINDCLIASVAYRLQVPIFTQNEKDFLKVLPPKLVIQPF